MPTAKIIWMWILTSCVGLLAGYLGGYLKKKAENKALKEDLEALTRAVEGVKAEIAEKSWDRQRHWEMKRDAILAMIQSLGLAAEALMNLAGTYQMGRNGGPDAVKLALKGNELSRTWLERMSEFDQKRFVASFLGGKDLYDAMRTAERSMRELAHAAMKGLPYDMDTDMPKIRAKVAAVQSVAKRELGIEREE